MLTPEDVIPYLLDAELIARGPVVRGEVAVLDVSRRNRNYKVHNSAGSSYLLKQGVDASGRATVAREAAVYRLLWQQAEAAALRLYLPRFYSYDVAKGLLLLELFTPAHNLRDYSWGQGRFPPRLGTELGRALAALHSLPPPPPGLIAPGPVPIALMLHRPPLDIVHTSSATGLRVLRIIGQFPAFAELLEELLAGWRRLALIHIDLKWENCLLAAAPGSTRPSRLKIVDWELADLGDPWWDVGSVLADYLNGWLQSIPITGAEPPEHFLQLARFPLASLHPAIAAFWTAYCRAMGLDGAAVAAGQVYAVRYAAARLLQTVIEQSQVAQSLTGNMICILQLSLNMLSKPEAAARGLLALPAVVA